MAAPEIALHRLRAQRIAEPRFESVAEVVRHLGAMQAQDYAASVWAIGLTDGVGDACGCGRRRGATRNRADVADARNAALGAGRRFALDGGADGAARHRESGGPDAPVGDRLGGALEGEGVTHGRARRMVRRSRVRKRMRCSRSTASGRKANAGFTSFSSWRTRARCASGRIGASSQRSSWSTDGYPSSRRNRATKRSLNSRRPTSQATVRRR